MNFINTTEDLYNMLDRYTEGVDWDTFYTKRDKPAPFLKYNKLPDKCVVDFIKEHNIENACEFGCGEGRNAIIFDLDLRSKKFDLVIDSGVFHHLAPHRRLQYRDIVSSILTENRYFILLCFAAGGNGADEVDDYEFYKSRQTGVAFTEERLKEFWGEKFDIVELRKGKNIVGDQMWESEYLYICVLKKA